MTIADLPVFSMLRTRMHWHQERQRLLAENIANADTPDFKPRDLAPPEFGQSLPPTAQVVLARTSTSHLAGPAGPGTGSFPQQRHAQYSVRPAGNAVNLEDEMLKVGSNAMDYQAAATLYSRSLGIIKMAIARR
jgi:flagellar basal-body rod protein FlgB